MLLEVVYPDKFYMVGRAAEVRLRLTQLARCYTTVKEMLEDLTPK
ncbi:MAG: Z-ring formation inhibitor MciZ [Eubacteriales bacterium]